MGTRFKINWTNNGEKYSIADNAMERGGQTVGTGMSQEMMMMGCGDENMPPNMDLLKQAGQGQTSSAATEWKLSSTDSTKTVTAQAVSAPQVSNQATELNHTRLQWMV